MKLDISSIQPLGGADVAQGDLQDPVYRAKAEAAAEKFEGMFIAEMLRQMRRTTRELAGEDSIFNDRINEDMMDVADGVLADSLSGQRAFGIADAILRQILPAPATVAAAPRAGLALEAAAPQAEAALSFKPTSE